MKKCFKDLTPGDVILYTYYEGSRPTRFLGIVVDPEGSADIYIDDLVNLDASLSNDGASFNFDNANFTFNKWLFYMEYAPHVDTVIQQIENEFPEYLA